MNYYIYTFLSEKIPNRLTMHAIVTYFLGKDKINCIDFKVIKNGKLIVLKTSFNYKDKDFEILLKDKNKKEFLCKLIKKEEFKSKIYSKEELVSISGLIEYGINITGKKGKKCPFFNGQFNSTELRNKFKENIEKKLGVEVLSMSRENFSRHPSEIQSHKIQFNNIIEMDLKVRIKEPELFNKIEFSSYFQKRSYGFGGLSCNE